MKLVLSSLVLLFYANVTLAMVDKKSFTGENRRVLKLLIENYQLGLSSQYGCCFVKYAHHFWGSERAKTEKKIRGQLGLLLKNLTCWTVTDILELLADLRPVEEFGKNFLSSALALLPPIDKDESLLENFRLECPICKEDGARFVNVPCGHFQSCDACIAAVKKNGFTKTCSQCRSDSLSLLRLKGSWDTCSKCAKKKPTHAFVECGHAAACESCSSAHCVICKEDRTSTVRIYF